LVQRLPVDARDAGDVFRRLEPALDFQRRDAGAREVGEDFEAGEVLRGEEVIAAAQVHFPAIGNQLVRHPAGLRALAAIRAAPAERLAGEALAAVCDAERAVDENFEGQ
jgi:hypothetical protein